jgi:ATPase subunit of ABC transporter with duplicated ATPase domains
MPSVCAEGLGFAYSDRVCLLENVSFRLEPRWYGMVGANGLGKTTLARLIAGELEPTAGRLWCEPKLARVVICPQEVDRISPELREFARAKDKESCRQRGLLGLDPAALEHWVTLSAGERKRWQLACALASAPDILILDEPTNHLDSQGREYLLTALRRYDGIGIAIAHDRELLAQLTCATLRIFGGTVCIYALSYAEARRAWLADEAHSQELRTVLVERERRVARRLDDGRRDQAAVQRQRSAKNLMKNIHDHDGSSLVRTGRANFADARLGRNVKLLGAEHERAVRAIPSFIVDKTLGRSVFLDYVPAPKPRILELDGIDLRAGNTLLVRDVRVALGRHTRVHLKGPNGVGKTTLLNALLASSASRERLMYLSQDLGPNEVREVQATARALPPTERGRLMSILAALGVDPERVMASSQPSPGEARKLCLAFGLGTHAWALLLDEPTNHLDLPSVERLEQALVDYPGAILLVTHDPQLARACTNQTWEIERQRLVVK